ncbi:MAG: OmpA family protein, partial [Bacteroidota bacterium]
LALQQKQKEVAEKEQVIKNLQAAINAQNQAMRDLLGKLQGALQQFSADLSLDIRDGKVYLGLSEKLLFKSGSAALGKDAMNVLEKLAAVLNQHPEINILVEGHTDNVPIKSKDFKDNWDLSVIRATTVVRILTKEFYLNPSQVLAAGKGEFEPKASNDTPEGRASNRRTEVILAPRLDEVMKILQQNR